MTEIKEGPKFNFVTQEFNKTLGSKTIHKIETLQIPFLWQSFEVGLEQTKNKNKQFDQAAQIKWAYDDQGPQFYSDSQSAEIEKFYQGISESENSSSLTLNKENAYIY